jgi:hypothetical protein
MGVAIMQWLGDAGRITFDVTYVMLVCGGFALLVSGLMLVSPRRGRQAGEWILIGTAALAVVLASDLVDKLDNGTVGVKLVMIALVASALKLSDTFAALQVAGSRPVRQPELTGLVKFLSIAVQLGFLVLLIRHFNLVSPVFCHQIIFLTLYGFLLHYFLPLRYRLPFFLFLSLSGIVFIFGFVQAGWLIGLGLILIGLCHLPIRFGKFDADRRYSRFGERSCNPPRGRAERQRSARGRNRIARARCRPALCDALKNTCRRSGET